MRKQTWDESSFFKLRARLLQLHPCVHTCPLPSKSCTAAKASFRMELDSSDSYSVSLQEFPISLTMRPALLPTADQPQAGPPPPVCGVSSLTAYLLPCASRQGLFPSSHHAMLVALRTPAFSVSSAWNTLHLTPVRLTHGIITQGTNSGGDWPGKDIISSPSRLFCLMPLCLLPSPNVI